MRLNKETHRKAGSTEDKKTEGEHNENKDKTEQNPDKYLCKYLYFVPRCALLKRPHLGTKYF